MSDSPAGPGWWQASDGQWYPPQASPPVDPYAPGPYAQPGPYQPAGYYGPPTSPPTNGKAIASMVLGIVSFPICYVGWIAAIVAVVLGFLAKREIDESGGQQQGRGMAVAGLVLGFVCIGLYAAVIAFVAAVAIFGDTSSTSGY